MIVESPIILDDVIPEKYQEEILHTLTMREFDWHYNPHVSYSARDIVSNFKKQDTKIKESRGFIHRFLVPKNNTDQPFSVKSEYCDFIRPILYFVEQRLNLNVKEILRIRGVISPKDISMKDFYNVPHIDSFIPHKTLIYYVNDNDGGTILFKEKYDTQSADEKLNYSKKTKEHFVKSKKGRVLLFDGLKYHTGVLPTDNDKILININFV